VSARALHRPGAALALIAALSISAAAGVVVGEAGCSSKTLKPPAEPGNAMTADLINYRNGLSLLKEGRADEAIALLQQARQAYPTDPNVWNALGLAVLYKKDFPDALKAFDQALFFDKKFMEARNNKGVALMEMGRLDDAEKEFRAVLDSPDSRDKSNARLNLGLLRGRQQRWSEAEAEFTSILADDPKFLRASRERGIVRVRKDDFRGGLDDLLRYLKVEPRDPEVNYSVALCLLAQGRRDLATKYMKRVVEAAPDGEEAKKARRFLEGEGPGGPGGAS
jgi:tetratricopeptide (TPR) repeat protein